MHMAGADWTAMSSALFLILFLGYNLAKSSTRSI